MKCPQCGIREAQHDSTYGVLPCISCQKNDDHPVRIFHSSLSKRDRAQESWDHTEKDMIQPYVNNKMNPEFVRAFPEESKEYFTKEELQSL